MLQILILYSILVFGNVASFWLFQCIRECIKIYFMNSCKKGGVGSNETIRWFIAPKARFLIMTSLFGSCQFIQLASRTSSIQASIGLYKCFFFFSEPLTTAEAPVLASWSYGGSSELLKETKGERQFHDDLGAESDRNEAWRPMSEVASQAALWLDSRTYHIPVCLYPPAGVYKMVTQLVSRLPDKMLARG